MIFFRKLGVLATLMFINQLSIAQFTDKYKFNNVPSSPEAALISRFGDIPISYYTGTAGVSLPLYSIKEGGLEIPITLNYHGSGIKVADEATWVGLGWDLSPAGMIVQEVRGKKDEDDSNLDQVQLPDNYNVFRAHLGPFQTGVYYMIGQTGDCLKTLPGYAICNTSSDAENILYRLQEGGGQPDIYTYNFDGLSGKFYIHPETHAIVLMDKKQDITFQRTSNGWTATTLDGNIFYFNVIESSQGYVSTDVRGVTFKLSQIVLHTGKKINFTYSDETTYGIFDRHSRVLIEFTSANQDYKTKDIIYNYKKNLTSIISGETTINFNLEARDDIDAPSTPKRLGSVDILSNINNMKIRSYQFSYSYFPNNYVGAQMNGSGGIDDYTNAHLNAYGHRLKLDSLKEIGYLNNIAVSTIPAYKFEYDLSNTLPFKNSYAVDFWGYYNGQNNTTLLPDLSYFDYGSDIKYKDTNALVYGYVGANRYTDNSYVSTYLLKKLKYPTGGFSEFEYEPNSFSNQYIPDQTKLAQASKLVNLIDNNDGISTTSQSFSFSKSQKVTFQNIINGYNVNRTAWTYAEMAGCYIEFNKIKMVSGSPQITLVKRWDLSTVLNADYSVNNSKTWNDTVLVPFDSDPTVSYNLKCYMPDNLNWAQNFYHSSAVSARCTYFDNIGVDTTITSQCGARIKSIKNYSDSGIMVSNKRIQYFGGKLLNKFEPLETRNTLHTKLVVNNGNHDVYSDFYKRITISSDDFGTGGGNLIGYDSVQEVQLNPLATDNIGKKVYCYNNVVNLTSKGFPNSPNLRNGFISKEIVYDKSSAKLLETEYAYTNLQAFNCYSGIRIVNSIYGDYDAPENPVFTHTNFYVPFFNYKFSYWMYPLISEWNMLQSKTVRQYQGGNYLTATENYTYNTKGQLINTASNNSKQQTKNIVTYYPSDNPGDPGAALLAGNNIYSQPIDIVSRINNNEVAKVHYNYGSIYISPSQNRIVNTSIQKSFNQGAYSTDVTFNTFSNNENVKSYTQNNVTNAVIWSDSNTHVIADIANADESFTAYTSFEENAKGKWVFSSGSVTQPATSLTGKKAYNLSGGLTGPVLSSGLTCVVSYWRNSNTGPYTVAGTQGTPLTGPTRKGWTYYEHKVITSSAVAISGTGLIDEVRLYPVDARMNSYTYQPLTGISSKCDPGNSIQYYEYDGYGRLILIRDQDNNILKKVCYNYAGKAVDCSGSCLDLNPNWQDITDSVRCQQNACGNTGYREQKQRDINTCSATYNTTRWLLGTNASACSATTSVNITTQNPQNITGYLAAFTNTTTSVTTTFSIPNGTNIIGCLPIARYNITIYKPTGLPSILAFSCGLFTISGESATFNNVNLSLSGNRTLAIAYDF